MGWGDWDLDPDEHASKQTPDSQVEVECYYVHETANALCVTDDLDGGEDMWFPKAAIAFERNGTKVKLWAPEKLLLDRGLI